MNDVVRIEKGTIHEDGYGLIPKKIMRDKEIQIEAKGIYSYISSFAGAGLTAFPSVSLICHELNISENRYYKYMNFLKSKDLIRVEKQKSPKGKFLRNVYTIVQSPFLYFAGMDNPGMENEGTISNSFISNSFKSNKNIEGQEKALTRHKHPFDIEDIEDKTFACLGDVYEVIDYYFEKYREHIGKEHPRLTEKQWLAVCDGMFYCEVNGSEWADLEPYDLQLAIDNHFDHDYGEGCDYCIIHFVEDNVLGYRLYDVGILA